MLWSAFLVMAAAILFAASAIINTNLSFPTLHSGRLIFPQTVADGLNFNRLRISRNGKSLSFELDNNFWLLKEADYYYADFNVLNSLFQDFNNAVYFSSRPFSPKALQESGLDDEQGILLETFSGEKPLDKVIIGKTINNGKLSFVRPAGSNEIWLTNGRYNLPEEAYSWLIQPILEFSPQLVEEVRVSGADSEWKLSRTGRRFPFFDESQNPVNPQILLERFNFLIAEDVRAAQNFDESLFPGRRKITLTAFEGLIADVDLFYDNAEYWVKISLLPARLPTAAVNAYIKDNAFRYDHWYFKIPAAAGRVLANFNINRE